MTADLHLSPVRVSLREIHEAGFQFADGRIEIPWSALETWAQREPEDTEAVYARIYESGRQAGITECLKRRETRWFGVAMEAIDASRRLVCEAEAMLRWFRGQDGPIDRDRLSGAWFDCPSLRVAVARLDSRTDPVALFEAVLTGRELRSRVRMTRRYRALRTAVRRTRDMQKRAWNTPGPDRVAPSPAEVSERDTLGVGS